MSIYTVNKVLRALLHDAAFRASMKADPRAALEGWALTEVEREALASGDVVTLYRLGTHVFLMNYLTRFEIAGLSLPVFNARMRSIPRDRQPIPTQLYSRARP